jgi:hypothetical protein
MKWEPSDFVAISNAVVSIVAILCAWAAGRRQVRANFRLAALEKRLEAHQEAYRLWHEMVLALNDPGKGPETAVRCQHWWFSHCLYLDANVREEFFACAQEAFVYCDLKMPDKREETKARFERIYRVFDLLEMGVQLPAISDKVREKEIQKT